MRACVPNQSLWFILGKGGKGPHPGPMYQWACRGPCSAEGRCLPRPPYMAAPAFGSDGSSGATAQLVAPVPAQGRALLAAVGVAECETTATPYDSITPNSIPKPPLGPKAA